MAKKSKNSPSRPSPRQGKTRAINKDYFSFLFDPIPDRGIRIARVGRVTLPPDAALERENGTYHIIEWIQSGRGELRVQGATSKLSGGSTFLVKPDIPYTVRNPSKRPMVKYSLTFEGERASTLLTEVGLSHSVTFHHAVSKHIQHTFDQLLSLGELKVHTRRMSELLFETLVLQISESGTKKTEETDPALETYRRCLHVIDTQFINIHTLADAATRAGVGSAYMCRLFKQYSDVSPYQLLLRKKLERAAWFLTHTDKLIKQIGTELGFSNPYRFSKAFKDHFGETPSAFAKKRRN